MSAHTAGPWVVSSEWYIRTESGMLLGEASLREDAVLMAAAPELLAALELLLAEHREFCAGGALPAEDVARAAIAKARGTP
jgi:hypothetical protein